MHAYSQQKMHMHSCMRSYATVQKLVCHESYCELILSLARASCRLSFLSCLLSSRNRSPDNFRSRNPSKSSLAHDVVTAAVSHKHRRRAWNARFGMEQRRWHQDAVQPVEHQSTSPRKCVQQEWSSTGKTADAVGSAFQTAGRWWPSASAGTRSACRNRHKLVFRSRDTERRVSQNLSRVATLGRKPW